MLDNVQSSSLGNSSEIWDKYHKCCIEISIFNATLVVFIPNFTATHAITSTNTTIAIAEYFISELEILQR